MHLRFQTSFLFLFCLPNCTDGLEQFWGNNQKAVHSIDFVGALVDSEFSHSPVTYYCTKVMFICIKAASSTSTSSLCKHKKILYPIIRTTCAMYIAAAALKISTSSFMRLMSIIYKRDYRILCEAHRAAPHALIYERIKLVAATAAATYTSFAQR